MSCNRNTTNFILLSIIIISLVINNKGNSQSIRRWPYNLHGEIASGSYNMEFKTSLFIDYLWTSPNYDPILLESLEPGKFYFKHKWKDSVIYIEKTGINIVTIKLSNGNEYTENRQTSNKDCYYDLSVLKLGRIRAQRFGQKITYKNGEIYETKLEPEIYSRNVYEVPKYNIYKFNIDSNETIIIYEFVYDDRNEFYFQNPSFYLANVNNKQFLFIDRNSNGIYFENEDLVLLNTNALYKYIELLDLVEEVHLFKIEHLDERDFISYIYKDEWFSLEFLAEKMFLKVVPDYKNNKVIIENDNDKYLNEKTTGNIKIIGLNKTIPIVFNGKNYSYKPDYQIEYGKYNLISWNEGKMFLDTIFEVNDENKEIVFNFTNNPLISNAILEFKNTITKSWQVIVSGDNYNKKYFNQKIIYLPKGAINISIKTEKDSFEKTIFIQGNEKYVFNLKSKNQTLDKVE